MTSTITETASNESSAKAPAKGFPSSQPSVETTSTETWIERHGIWLLGVFACFIFFFRLGGYWLFDVDEPRYAEAAREMIEKKSWITPYFNYALRLEKPVLFYWLEIISYQCFGVSEFSARLVSALAATSLTGMTYALGRHMVSKQFGFYAAVILMTSLEFIGLSRMSITDMTLSCMLGGTFISLFLAVSKHPRWWLIGGLFSGLAILTKGPVGLILPGSTLIAYSVLTRQWKKAFFTPYFPTAIILALAVAAPWYYLAWKENGQFFIDSLLQNNVSRFSGAIDYHSEPFYYYGIVLLAGFLPWTPFIIPGILNSIQTWKQKKPMEGTLSNFEQVHWYAAVWSVLVFAFFTAADTKLLTYILPMFPALSLWIASAFEGSKKDPKLSQSLSKTSWVLFGILGVVGIVFSTQMGSLLPKEAAHISSNPANWIVSALLLAGTFYLSRSIQKKQVTHAFVGIGVTFSLIAIVALQAIVPHVNQATQGTLMEYLYKIGKNPIATYEITKPSLTFYAQRKVLAIKHESNNDPVERDTLKAFLNSGCTLDRQGSSHQQNSGQKTGSKDPHLETKHCGPVYLITKNRFIEPLLQNLPKEATVSFVDKTQVYSLIKLQAK